MTEGSKTTEAVERLSAVLDSDIENLQKMLTRLDSMRSAVIKRDDAELAGILNEIRSDEQIQQERQNQREQIRREIAEIFEVSLEKITLTFLEKRVSETQKKILADKKKQLRILSGDLKREYAATVFLLGQCAKINKQMLDAIFNRGKGDAVIYDSGGTARRENGAAFVNMKL